MREHIIGFLGFGKAAVIFAEDMRAAAMNRMRAYDKYWANEPYGKIMQRNADRLDVQLVRTPWELANEASIVLSMVTPDSAEEAAKSIAQFLPDHAFYIDLNSTAPMIKQRNSETLKKANPSVHYLDGCILGAVPESRLKTPILLCGQAAQQAKEMLDAFGTNIEIIDGVPGDASAVKMMRSVFMKGIEALFIEALHGARAYNIERQLLGTLKDTFETLTFEQLVNTLISTHPIHSKRRHSEMADVVKTLEAKQVDTKLATSIREKFGWSTELRLMDYFNNEPPASYNAVIEAIYKTTKEL